MGKASAIGETNRNRSRWTLRGRRDGMRGKLHRVTRETSLVAGDGRNGSV